MPQHVPGMDAKQERLMQPWIEGLALTALIVIFGFAVIQLAAVVL